MPRGSGSTAEEGASLSSCPTAILCHGDDYDFLSPDFNRELSTLSPGDCVKEGGGQGEEGEREA
jgi:hypothetical protein